MRRIELKDRKCAQERARDKIEQMRRDGQPQSLIDKELFMLKADYKVTEKMDQEVEMLRQKRDKIFNATDLRRTIIYQLPCDFTKFEMREKRKAKPGQPIVHIMTDVTKEYVDRECERVREQAYKDNANVEQRLQELVDEKMVNLRAKIWPIMCGLPDLQDEMLQEHDRQR